jgi:hypothetical protein
MPENNFECPSFIRAVHNLGEFANGPLSGVLSRYPSSSVRGLITSTGMRPRPEVQDVVVHRLVYLVESLTSGSPENVGEVPVEAGADPRR